MKNLIIIFLISILASCSNPQNVADDIVELEKLKKEQAALKEKINLLEANISAKDTSNTKSKLVGVLEIHPVEFNHFIEIQAKVEGDQDILLSAESAGSVTSVNVRPGDRVQTGQLLASIDDNIISQSILEMQSQLDLARQLFNRQKNLWDQKIGSEIQFLQAQTNKNATEKRMDILKQQLEMTKIKSPINGTINDVEIKIGQTVMPGFPAIRVVNLSSLKVKGEVAESFITRVKKGNEVVLIFPDQNKEIKTKIDFSGNRIDLLNRTFNVEVRLPDNQGNFHPNMLAVMRIIDYKNPTAFVVPLSAVQKSTDGQFVYVLHTDGKRTIAKRKIIESGMIYNGQIEIKSGLVEGDKVITNGFQNVIEGDIVNI